MVVRITPPGGRTRRRGGAVSLSGGDVPLVQPARDPGVNVPLIPIPVDETAGAIGAGLSGVANVLDEFVVEQHNINKREESLDRDAVETAHSDRLQDTIRDFQGGKIKLPGAGPGAGPGSEGSRQTADLSNSADVQAIGQQMLEEKERILDEHNGGQTSKRLLDNRLTKLNNRFADTLAVLNINAADVKFQGAMTKRISSITQDVLTDPDVINDQVDLVETYRSHVENLGDEIEFLDPTPDQARRMRRVGESEIALTMVTPLIRNGQFERANELLRSEEIRGVLSPGQQRDAAQRIVDAQRELAGAKSEADELIEMARVLNPPEASAAQIRATARELKNLGDENKGQFFEMGGRIVFINEDTLELTEVLAGPTVEEEAARTKANEIARLTGNLEVVSNIAASVGVEIFGPVSTAGAEKGTPQPAKPTSTEKEGEPTSPEQIVPPLPMEAITHPYGSDEPPASGDMQKVLGLMTLSRVLMLMGETASANGFRADARMIIETSQEIQDSKDLNRRVTDLNLLSVTGHEFGTRMGVIVGQVIPSPDEIQARKQAHKQISLAFSEEFQLDPFLTNSQAQKVLEDRKTFARSGGELEGAGAGAGAGGRFLPRSPEERAEAVAFRSKRGSAQVEAEEQISFIDETRGQILNLKEKLVIDPKLVGILGGLRSTGRNVFTALSDLGFGAIVDAAQGITVDDVDFTDSDLGVDYFLDLFDDPTLSSLDILNHSIGLNLARLRTRAGRIPVEIIRISIADSKLTGGKGGVVVADRLDFILGLLDAREENILRRFPGIPRDDLDEEEGVSEEQEDFSGIQEFELKDGKYVPVQE